MKLKITKQIEQTEVVDIELPYYYKHDLLLDYADVVIYGKIEENKCTHIKIDRGRDELVFELSTQSKPAAQYGCYITDEYKSSEAEYLAAKVKLLAAASAA